MVSLRSARQFFHRQRRAFILAVVGLFCLLLDLSSLYKASTEVASSFHDELSFEQMFLSLDDSAFLSLDDSALQSSRTTRKDNVEKASTVDEKTDPIVSPNDEANYRNRMLLGPNDAIVPTTTIRRTHQLLEDYRLAQALNATTKNSTTILPLPLVARFPNNRLVVIVLSQRSHHEFRRVLRETWAHNQSVYFVVGGTTPHEPAAVQAQLEQESVQYGDILDSILPESNKRHPYMLHFAYQWVVANLPKVQWILQANDHTVVRMESLQRSLLNLYNPNQHIVIGNVREAWPNKTSSPQANASQYNVPSWTLAGTCGPLVSRPVATYIAIQQNWTYDSTHDTSVLPTWLDQYPLPVWWIDSPFFVPTGRCRVDDFLVLGHQDDPHEIRQCYQQRQEMDNWDEWHVKAKRTQYLFFQSFKQRRDEALEAAQAKRREEAKKKKEVAARQGQNEKLVLQERIARSRQWLEQRNQYLQNMEPPPLSPLQSYRIQKRREYKFRRARKVGA